MRSRPDFNRKEQDLSWMGKQSENTYVIQIASPTSKSEIFRVLVQVDADGDFDEIIGHDMNEQNLGYIMFEVANNFEPYYVIYDALAVYQDGLVSLWIMKQIQETIRELRDVA